jgi:hypothetical protein
MSRVPVGLRVVLGLAPAALLFVSCSSVRFKSPADLQTQCDAQIIVTFVDEGEPDIGDVAQTARVRLELRRQIGPSTYVLALRSTGRDPDCTLALSRLRRDSRIAAADLDLRRKPQ